MKTFWKTNDYKETKLRIHNITAKAAFKFGSEAWVLKEQDEQGLQGAHMKFLRNLLGITKLDRERNQSIREKLKSAEHSFANKTIPMTVATTCRENGQRQDTQTGIEI
jgi:hypothetical protein